MIEIENLHFEYKKGSPVFKNLSLSLSEGHIYGLLGKNGAGKSTLLKNIIGLNFPGTGKCLVNGMNSAHRQIAMLEDVFFIPEDIHVPSQTPAQFQSLFEWVTEPA